MRKPILILFLLLIAWAAYSLLFGFRVRYDRRVTLDQEPLQYVITRAPFDHKGFKITPVATFNIEARILSKRRYYFGKGSKIAPVDYALGWGPMSNYRVLKDIRITQFNRWYYYFYSLPPPIPKGEIIAHSANMHLVPANNEIAARLQKGRRGQIVRIRGLLVNVEQEKGPAWKTSTSRTDTGSGSCEIIWVNEVEFPQKTIPSPHDAGPDRS